MDIALVLQVATELLFGILLLSIFLLFSLFKGRYALVNCILGLYLALLLTLIFPYFESLARTTGSPVGWLKIVFFLSITIIGTILFRRLVPGDDFEKIFSNFGKKFLLATTATLFVLALCFNIFPITDLLPLQTDSSLYTYVSSENLFFWWAVLPLVVIFFI